MELCTGAGVVTFYWNTYDSSWV